MPNHPPHKLLVVGGGPAAIEAVLAARDLAPTGALDIELITADPEFVYRPMSVVEPFARPGLRRYPLADLEGPGVRVRLGRMTHVHPDERRIVLGDGTKVAYDALLVAVGAWTKPALHGLNFGGHHQAEMMHGLVRDMEGGYLKTFAFVAPEGAAWTLPLYELALQTAERAYDGCLRDVRITFVSHEAQPLEVFGEAASAKLAQLLEDAGIHFRSGSVVPGADRVVALPVQVGHPIDGLPHDAGRFLPVDAHNRVLGVEHVWAAGDGTDRSPRQGGLATQQADAAVRSILATFGHGADPIPYEPVLRAVLVAGRHSYYLRRRLNGRDAGTISDRAIWWPPTKIAGRYLAPYLDRIDAATQQPRVERELQAAARLARLQDTTPVATPRGL